MFLQKKYRNNLGFDRIRTHKQHVINTSQQRKKLTLYFNGFFFTCFWIFSLTLTSINWPSKRRKTTNVTTLRLTPCSQFWGKNEDLAHVLLWSQCRVKLIRSSFITCLGGIDRVIGRIYMRLHWFSPQLPSSPLSLNFGHCTAAHSGGKCRVSDQIDHHDRSVPASITL